ncbi:MAG: N-acetylmuramoyl-L-alanine amidase [Deltaproteobacteria bacterium]|nr:N-acetylmuramoyl-L-alanine amidase [Deltaproteobacteria bacterium]
MTPVFNIKIRRAFFLLALVFFLLQAQTSSSLVTPSHVEDVRYWSAPNYTRVVITLSRKTDYAWRLLKQDASINKPRRLYIDVSSARLGSEVGKEIPINDGLLKVVRTAQHDRDTVRVVLDIQTIEDYKVFPLSNPYRIVIDVLGEGSKFSKAKAAGLTLSVPGAIAPGGAGGDKEGAASKKTAIRTIVIDPGHGGKDPGAIGPRGLEEKEVTLKIARRLKDELGKLLDSKIILTREKDVYIPLDERTAIANSREADLFVSVHANASARRLASGVETYYLGSTEDREAIRVAARENNSSAAEMSDTLRYILKDLQRSGNQQESIRLAAMVQEGLSGELKRHYGDSKSNGIKGALFYVIVNCNMPSILVEVSFISNPVEEDRMRGDRYIEEITKGISAGILKYINGGAGGL